MSRLFLERSPRLLLPSPRAQFLFRPLQLETIPFSRPLHNVRPAMDLGRSTAQIAGDLSGSCFVIDSSRHDKRHVIFWMPRQEESKAHLAILVLWHTSGSACGQSDIDDLLDRIEPEIFSSTSFVQVDDLSLNVAPLQ